jgi:hypothetical protein
LKAGIPFEIASMPVTAALPRANAPSRKKIVTSCVARGKWWVTGSSPKARYRTRPTTIVDPTSRRNAYVGIANSTPDSRTPRRFMSVMNAMTTRAIATREPYSPGANETMAATPAATLTDTVRM